MEGELLMDKGICLRHDPPEGSMSGDEENDDYHAETPNILVQYIFLKAPFELFCIMVNRSQIQFPPHFLVLFPEFIVIII